MLSPGEVRVVRIPLNGFGNDPEALSLLDNDERDRASRFVFSRDRRRFIAAHARMRQVLGRCLDVPPGALRFSYGPNGKPDLSNAPVDLRFNLAHAGDRALLALGIGRAIGVDLEQERPLEATQIARRFFSRDEQIALEAMPQAQQQRAFFRCWTRKESFIKALGLGLSFPLGGFTVSLEEEEQAPQLLLGCSAAPAELARWTLVALPAEEGYAAALAVEGTGWRVVEWEALEATP